MEGHAQRTESIKMLQALIETLDLSRLILMIIHTRKLLTSKTYCTERKIFSMTLQYAKTLKAPNKKWEKQTYWVNGVFFWSLILATPPPFSPLSFQATVPGTKMCEVLKNEETYSSVKVSILGFVDFCFIYLNRHLNGKPHTGTKKTIPILFLQTIPRKKVMPLKC